MKKRIIYILINLLFVLFFFTSCDLLRSDNNSGGGGGGGGGGGSDPVYTITGVTISPNAVTVGRGDNCLFTATVMGTNNPPQDVIWSVSNGGVGTNITSTGLLTIADNETAEFLVITAVSNYDRTKSANAIVTVTFVGGDWTIANVDEWIEALRVIRDGRNNAFYTLNIAGDIVLPVTSGNTFGSPTGIVVTIQGEGSLSLSANGSLIQSGNGQTITIRDITLNGRSGNNASLVIVNTGSAINIERNALVTGNQTSGSAGGVLVRSGGVFVLEDSVITGNSSSESTSSGGVFIDGGSFFMRGSSRISENSHNNSWGNGVGGVFVRSNGVFSFENGVITLNTSSRNAGGVRVASGGVFTMQNGTISFNIANNGSGGGVYVEGTFTLQNGMISGNTAREGNGGGLYLSTNASFTKPGGTITGTNTQPPDGNNATNQGAAAFRAGSNNSQHRWRNVAAGPNDPYDEFFWRND